jgi:glutaryl-CoA dehydrogenase
MADVIVVWARDDDDHVGAFLVEGGTPGLRTAVIEGKTAKRAIWQSDVWLEEVMLPADARLARARTFRDATELLTIGRHNVAWEAIGNALACYEIALAYSRRRTQFGRPLASFQLVQERLAHMAVEIAGMQLLALRISQLLDEGRLSAAAASIAKRNNAAKARTICSDARDLLGGNGILHDFHVARHLADAEAVYSYEGTDAVQALIIGRALTGLNAFA